MVTKIYNGIQEYIGLVDSGVLRVCKEQKQLVGLVKKVFREEKVYVDEDEAEKYLALQKYFPFNLLPWEKFVFTLHYCTYEEKGLLRFPDLAIYVGRGAGKNGLAGFEAFCGISPYNKVKRYNISICANSEDQAKTSFMDVYEVLESNKEKMKRFFRWNKEEIVCLRTGAVLKFLTSSPKTKDGLRDGEVILDEVHQYENRKNIDVFTSGLGKVANPRRLFITTDGYVRDGPLDDYKRVWREILSGKKPLKGLLPFMCCLDDPEEVNDPENWQKANPSLIYFPHLQSEIEKEWQDIQDGITDDIEFMTKRMNSPKGDAFRQVTSWDNLLTASRDIPDVSGWDCVFCIDYANIRDFATIGLLFRNGDEYYWKEHTWVNRQGKFFKYIEYPIDEAEKQGLLTVVNAVEIAPELLTNWLKKQAFNCNIVYGGIDNFKYSVMARALRSIGFSREEKNLWIIRPNDIMKASALVESSFRTGKIAWGENNSLMRWFTNNTFRTEDKYGNVSYGKIEPKLRKNDGFMAMAGAFSLVEHLPEFPVVSDFDIGVMTF